MVDFSWDADKSFINLIKHGVDFKTAARAFQDPDRQIAYNPEHSGVEDRYFCFGRVGDNILTVRFTYRGDRIRIIGAGYWRKGRKIYYEKKKT